VPQAVEEGHKAVKSIKEFGSPVMDVIGPIPYGTAVSARAGDAARRAELLEGGIPDGLTDGLSTRGRTPTQCRVADVVPAVPDPRCSAAACGCNHYEPRRHSGNLCWKPGEADIA
jgi:hypothetical protein